MGTVRWIINTVGNRGWLVALLCVLKSLLAVSSVVFALLMRRAVDSAAAGLGNAFVGAAAAMGLLILLNQLMRAAGSFFEEETRSSMENSYRQTVFCSIMDRDYRFAAAYHTGEMMNRLTSDAAVVTNGVTTLVPGLLSTMIRVLGALGVLYGIDPHIALLFLAGGCLMTGISLLPRRWLKKHHRRVQESDGYVRSFLQECLESLLIIQTFRCEEKMERRAVAKMEDHRRARRMKKAVSNLFGGGMNLTVQCGCLLGFLWGGVGILQGRITYGTMTALLQLIGQIQAPFASIGGFLPQFSAMFASAERLMELCSERGSMQGRECLPEIAGMTAEQLYAHMEEIRFSHVFFSYEKDMPVLEDVSFTVGKGEIAAFSGISGIGKSTVMKLLLSVYQPESGEVVLQLDSGSVSVTALPPGLFAYVPQSNCLMGGTIWEVVGFAEKSEEIDRKKVVRACQTACAHEFIMELKMKYDTILGEKGAGLSEGQLQRLAVARAVYSGCPILLLDEATSALDSVTEERLVTSLKALSGRTVFLITHRKEVWNLCDRIIERE